MNKNKSYVAILAIFILTGLVYSCRKDGLESNSPPDPKVAWAKDYFQNVLLPNQGNQVTYSKMNKVSSTISEEKKANMKTPVWAKAKQGYNEGLEFVEAPVLYTRKILSAISKNKEKIDMEIPMSSFDRLVIYKDGNGKINQFIISYIPDKDYLLRHIC